jgi:hypothetical protein
MPRLAGAGVECRRSNRVQVRASVGTSERYHSAVSCSRCSKILTVERHVALPCRACITLWYYIWHRLYFMHRVKIIVCRQMHFFKVLKTSVSFFIFAYVSWFATCCCTCYIFWRLRYHKGTIWVMYYFGYWNETITSFWLYLLWIKKKLNYLLRRKEQKEPERK